MPPAYQIKAKVVMVGDAAVGKTSLVRRFVHDQFSDTYAVTLGAKVLARDTLALSPDGQEVAVRLAIWDIMGESSLLDEVSETFFHGAQGVVAVCDLTRYSTFERLPLWLRHVNQVAGSVPMALAVNKSDLQQEVLVLYDDYRVQQFAEEVGARWYMTSAKTGENVADLFSTLGQDITARALSTAPPPEFR
ncbi:MAG TPA: Rab family GTPase [Thermoplasmata archaeon]|nr:Rab family GTPase [Thermoplasmata archaeon]